VSRPREGQGLLPFEAEADESLCAVTAHGGLPLLVEAARALGVDQACRQHLRIKQRRRGFDEAAMVESFMTLFGAGGECLDDFATLSADGGLARLLGRALPKPTATRDFLYAFHDEKLTTRPKDAPKAWIPAESAPLQQLHAVNVAAVHALAQHQPELRDATVDLDATIIASRKREALPVYEGGRGYQPQLAVWAEAGVVVADQFRDGNVPAEVEALAVAKRAFAALPAQVERRGFRGDSACYTHDLLNWLRDEHRADGPQGFIGFAISADMSPSLAEHIAALPATAWQPYFPGRKDEHEERFWAEVEFTPSDGPVRKDVQPDRYVAVRIVPRQGDLFDRNREVKHFAIVSNRRDVRGDRLIEWHREKAGTIEAVHDVLKNELGAGVMPCGRFGANAAWLRLNVLTFNVLAALRRLALPPALAQARPKRLRFKLFALAGRIVAHARQLTVRLGITAADFATFLAARRALRAAAFA